MSRASRASNDAQVDALSSTAPGPGLLVGSASLSTPNTFSITSSRVTSSRVSRQAPAPGPVGALPR